jgi:hypothetical protein
MQLVPLLNTFFALQSGLDFDAGYLSNPPIGLRPGKCLLLVDSTFSA